MQLATSGEPDAEVVDASVDEEEDIEHHLEVWKSAQREQTVKERWSRRG